MRSRADVDPSMGHWPTTGVTSPWSAPRNFGACITSSSKLGLCTVTHGDRADENGVHEARHSDHTCEPSTRGGAGSY
jgi:hypothetical protein